MLSSEPSVSCNLFAIVTSKIADYHNKYNNNEKVWNIVRITKTWHRDMKESKCCWKNCTDRLAYRRFVRNLQFVKNTVSAKHNKMRYACTVLQKACTCVTTSRSRNRTLPSHQKPPYAPTQSLTPDSLKQTMACRPSLANICELKTSFYVFKLFLKIKRRIVFHDSWKLYDVQISMSMKF